MIEMDEMKGRGKRGLLRVVFGRTMFFLLLIALINAKEPYPQA